MIVTAVLAAAMSFTSLPLLEAERDALTSSPEVVAALARIRQSQAQLDAARASLGPSLVANYAQSPQGNPPGPTITSQMTTVQVQTTLGDLFAYQPAVRSAAQSLVAARSDGATATRAERIKVIGLYFDALRARAVDAARLDALQLANQQREAAQKRLAAGDAPRLDVVRADVAVARATSDLENAKAADANASEALRLETGVPAAALTATSSTSGHSEPAPIDVQQAIDRALSSRPEIASAHTALLAEQDSLRAVRRQGLPALTLGAGYAQGTDSGVHVNGPNVTAQLTIPLSSVAHDRVALEAGKVDEAAAKEASVRRAVELEVGSAARSLAATQRATVAATRARTEAFAELQATELGYRSGASSSLEVATARATYTQALVDELSAQFDEAKARATLEIQTEA